LATRGDSISASPISTPAIAGHGVSNAFDPANPSTIGIISTATATTFRRTSRGD
jgi:hypothetical protein